MFIVSTPSYITIRNINPSNSLVWMNTFNWSSVSIKGLSVSPNEQFLCVANKSGNLVVIWLYTSDGTLKENKYL